MTQIKKVLFAEYNGFADKRIKNIDKDCRFIVDDRLSKDVGADLGLLSYFCSIFADVVSEAEVTVQLYGNVPINSSVKKWIKNHGADFRESLDKSLSFSVKPGGENILTELADEIVSIVAPGASRYDVPSYKYVCPRTAASLRRLSNVLSRAWGT